MRGGRGVPARPSWPAPESRFIWLSIALISLSWPSIDCSRSAMPTSCARLGRFMPTRYFSIISPSCFCAPAAAPPAWFITLENSGEAIAWLAKELNPFSISAIIVCQTTAGSLPLSAIGALSCRLRALATLRLLLDHTTPLRWIGQPAYHRAAHSPATSPLRTACFEIFSPPPGDSDVISQVDR